jgi:predicted metal-dependent hydrolase
MRFEITITLNGNAYLFHIHTDARLRTTGRWVRKDGAIVLRVPPSLSRSQVEKMAAHIAQKIEKGARRAAKQTDSALQQRAEQINAAYFGGELVWRSIRWVGNMRNRLGSCTTGGPTDGDIRISERIRGWPSYVIDYIIAHELCHRKHPDHRPEFWAFLARFPHTERARGFIEGVAYAEGSPADSLLD